MNRSLSLFTLTERYARHSSTRPQRTAGFWINLRSDVNYRLRLCGTVALSAFFPHVAVDCCGGFLGLGFIVAANARSVLPTLGKIWLGDGLDQYAPNFGYYFLSDHHADEFGDVRDQKRRNATSMEARCLNLSDSQSGENARKYGATFLMLEATVDFLKDIWAFLRERKKYWLLPLIISLVMVGALIILSQASVIAPFIYTLF